MMTMSGAAVPPPMPQQQGGQTMHPPGGGGEAAASSRRMKPEDAAQHITVSDPVQHADGLNKYTSYRVDVRPPNPAMMPGQPLDPMMMMQNAGAYSAVLRRYSDFLWLYERLHIERAGAIVPPIPEKQPVGRFSPAFVEDRRVNLERFLRRVAVHPELADAQCLDTFLRADDVSFQAAKNAKAGAPVMNMSASQQMHMPYQQAAPSPASAKAKDGIKRWFAEAKTSMTGDLVRSPDDDIFEEIQRYIHGLDTQMRNVSHQATGLVRKGKEIANGMFEFGLAFNLLGQSEADALGDALGKMGETADKLSVLSAEHAEKEMSQFEEPLQDYIKTIHAVKLALQRRHEKRLTYSTCLAEVESKNHALSKYRTQIGSEAKAYSTEMSLRRAQDAAEAAREDFAVVSQRVLREVDRFKREKAEDMRRTVLDYINLQVEYNKRMEEVWAQLIPKLESVQLDSNSNAAPPPAMAAGGRPPVSSVPGPAAMGGPGGRTVSPEQSPQPPPQYMQQSSSSGMMPQQQQQQQQQPSYRPQMPDPNAPYNQYGNNSNMGMGMGPAPPQQQQQYPPQSQYQQQQQQQPGPPPMGDPTNSISVQYRTN